MSSIREILAAASKACWRIERLGSGHVRALSPCGRHIVHVSGTPSDWRALHKIRSNFRRAGLALR